MTAAFSCPHCSTTLRVRERSLVGQQVACPDCGGPIVIVGDGPRGFTAQKPKAHGPRPAGVEKAAPTGGLLSPVGIGWAVAGAATVALLAAVFWPVSEEQGTAETATDFPPAAVEAVVNHQVLRPPMPDASSNGNAVEKAITDDELPPIEPPTEPKPPREEPPEIPAALPAAERELPDAPGVATRPPAPRSALPTPNAALLEPPTDLPADRETVFLALQPPALTKDDIAAALAQPIARFEQSRPVAARTLLFEIEEMAGVPIEIDPAISTSGSPLDRPVTLRLEHVTVEEILEELLGQLGLTFEIREDAALIVP